MIKFNFQSYRFYIYLRVVHISCITFWPTFNPSVIIFTHNYCVKITLQSKIFETVLNAQTANSTTQYSSSMRRSMTIISVHAKGLFTTMTLVIIIFYNYSYWITSIWCWMYYIFLWYCQLQLKLIVSFVHILALVALPLTLWASTGPAAHKLHIAGAREQESRRVTLPGVPHAYWAAHQIMNNVSRGSVLSIINHNDE